MQRETWRVVLATLVAGVLYAVFGMIALIVVAGGMSRFSPGCTTVLGRLPCGPDPLTGTGQIAVGTLALYLPAILAVYTAGTARPRRTAVVAGCLVLLTWGGLVAVAAGTAS